MKQSSPSASFAYVYDGQRCIGHVVNRGRMGSEAFDTADRSLGLFPTQREAADAISEAAA